MWPFSKKPELPGLKRTKEGSISFDITDEEQQEIDKTYEVLSGLFIRDDIRDKLKQGLIARGLANYATDQVIKAKFATDPNSREECMCKAIASITKAYSIHSLPIYAYDLACYLEMANRLDESKYTFKLFLKHQSDFRPEPLDDILMGERDISEPIRHATTKI